MADTIAQIATGTQAGVGIVRLSGPLAHSIGRALVTLITAPEERKAILRRAREEGGESIDQGLYLEFVGPRSLTGEDVAEFQGHGSGVGLSRILRRCLQLGARAAEPGEFSLRAFENGRLDLAQAEAIAAGIAAATESAHRLAARQASGELSCHVAAIRAPLIRAAATLNAEIEFPDENLFSDGSQRAPVITALGEATTAVQALLRGYRAGRLLSEGAEVVLVGPPNAGKSSLLNAFLGRDRAIVSPLAGTTRDTVEERLVLEGLAVRLVDTAGLRETTDAIERAGIARTEAAMARADVIVALVSEDSDWLGFVRAQAQDERVLWVWNKADRAPAPAALSDLIGVAIPISARSGEGLETLRLALQRRLRVEEAGGALVSIERHALLLTQAEEALLRAVAALRAPVPGDLVLVDVGIAIHRLSALVGENLDHAVYAEIFRHFCIGK